MHFRTTMFTLKYLKLFDERYQCNVMMLLQFPTVTNKSSKQLSVVALDDGGDELFLNVISHMHRYVVGKQKRETR